MQVNSLRKSNSKQSKSSLRSNKTASKAESPSARASSISRSSISKLSKQMKGIDNDHIDCKSKNKASEQNDYIKSLYRKYLGTESRKKQNQNMNRNDPQKYTLIQENLEKATANKKISKNNLKSDQKAIFISHSQQLIGVKTESKENRNQNKLEQRISINDKNNLINRQIKTVQKKLCFEDDFYDICQKESVLGVLSDQGSIGMSLKMISAIKNGNFQKIKQ